MERNTFIPSGTKSPHIGALENAFKTSRFHNPGRWSKRGTPIQPGFGSGCVAANKKPE
jgi:hypothetical protein